VTQKVLTDFSTGGFEEVLSQVALERQRQDQLKALGKFQYTCADPQPGSGAKLAILMEEVGEVARELNEDGMAFKLREELIQVAAVACAWIEALNRIA